MGNWKDLIDYRHVDDLEIPETYLYSLLLVLFGKALFIIVYHIGRPYANKLLVIFIWTK